MGKSTATAILARLGVAVVDTDEIARDLVKPGEPALGEIRDRFGSGVFREDGSLNRPALAEIVFKDPEARRDLEGILHPRIREGWGRQIGDWAKGGLRCGVVVIPLLFETKAEAHFDAIVCVACTGATQRRRLRERGWTDEHLERRLAAQMSVETKMQRSQYVIWTEVPVAVHQAQIEQVLSYATKR